MLIAGAGDRGRRRVKRPIVGVVVGLALALGTAIGVLLATLAPGQGASPSPSGSAVAASVEPSSSPPAEPTSPPTPTPRPTATPSPTPVPTPPPVEAPLTGRLVPPATAQRHVIAVMVDDLSRARPQSGFNAASIVWHAPAEGGIPRYMLLFQDRVPDSVGPVRSARQYYIAWAAEWQAMYVHVGGSPQALRTLRDDGQGELVYDADEFRWGGRYLWRTTDRFPPHNVYSDGEHLYQLARRLGADAPPGEAAWQFAPEAPLERRPQGGRIVVPYLANEITYRYDRRGNRYVRSVTGASPQVDRADGKVVAPKNVVVLFMSFSPLDDGHPEKKRLEADYVGSGRALIATNGRTIEGTWRKAAIDEPTLLFDADGRPITLSVGQTFVQVVETGTTVTVSAGKAVPRDPGSIANPY
jgi:hypothetical protein